MRSLTTAREMPRSSILSGMSGRAIGRLIGGITAGVGVMVALEGCIVQPGDGWLEDTIESPLRPVPPWLTAGARTCYIFSSHRRSAVCEPELPNVPGRTRHHGGAVDGHNSPLAGRPDRRHQRPPGPERKEAGCRSEWDRTHGQ